MLKLANQVVDFYDDVTKDGLRKIAHLAPGVVALSADERSRLRDDDFALCMITKKAAKLLKYPIHDRDSTWLSNQYFGLYHDNLPKTAAMIAARNIKTACARFGVPPTTAVNAFGGDDSEKVASSNVCYESSAEPLEKRASFQEVSLEKIAQVAEIGDNYTSAQYALSTPAHVKVACRYFEDKLDKIPLEQRHKYAAAIQRRAHELGMGQQKGAVVKYAADHYSAHVDSHIQSRATLLETQPAQRDLLTKLAAAKKELPPAKFASALHNFDKQAGLTRYYGSALTNPYEATFAAEPDQYAGYRVKVAGITMTHEDVQSLASTKLAKVKEYFGDTIAQEFGKNPVAIFDSLPMDAKEILARISDGLI